MRNKLKLSFMVLSAAIVSAGFLYYFQNPETESLYFPLAENKKTPDRTAKSDAPDSKTISVYGTVELIVKDSQGNVKQHIKRQNLVVNDGLDFSMKRVFSDSPPASTIKFVALGEQGGGSVSSDESELKSEINSTSTDSSPCYKRADATVTQNVDVGGESKGTVKLEKTFDVVDVNNSCSTALSEGDIIIRSTGKKLNLKEAGIFDSDSGGTMFSRFIFDNTVTLDSNGESMTVIWKIDYD